MDQAERVASDASLLLSSRDTHLARLAKSLGMRGHEGARGRGPTGRVGVTGPRMRRERGTRKSVFDAQKREPHGQLVNVVIRRAAAGT